MTDDELWAALKQIPGGYKYDGVASIQICFPLRAGGELRFAITNEDYDKGIQIDLYGGELPPGILGPTTKTGPTR